MLNCVSVCDCIKEEEECIQNNMTQYQSLWLCGWWETIWMTCTHYTEYSFSSHIVSHGQDSVFSVFGVASIHV